MRRRAVLRSFARLAWVTAAGGLSACGGGGAAGGDVAYRGRLRSLPMGFNRALHAGAELSDGRVAFFGGESGSGAAEAARVHAFDPKTQTFAPVGALISARDGCSATTLGDGRVLVVGAPLLSGAPRAELFDPAFGTSTPLGLATYRSHHTATLLADGRVLLAGGSPTAAATNCELFDPTTGSVRTLASGLNMPRVDHKAVRLNDGSVLICGGVTLSGQPAGPERFDPQTERFTTLAPAPADASSQRVGHALVRNAAGATFVFGGEDASTGVPSTAAYSLRADRTQFEDAVAMPHARSWHTATPLLDGRTLVAGGFVEQNTQVLARDCDLLSADGAVWAGGPALITPRVLHSAHLLSTGQVLIVGGNDAGGAVLGSAELFD